MVIKEVAELWKADKKQYVKESTYSAYCLLVANHIIPYFGEKEEFMMYSSLFWILLMQD